MSLPWWRELRVGIAPGRLILRGSVHAVNDPAVELKSVGTRARLAVVLSNHFARYAVLPWSAALGSEDDWHAFARHNFAAVYGAGAAAWTIRVSSAGRGFARVACAIDTALLDSLRAVGSVASIQPYLMAAFNRRARSLDSTSAWFVIQESGCLTACLVQERQWRLVRNRRVNGSWHEALSHLLERERAASDGTLRCDRVLLYAESMPPSALGEYRLTDTTLPRGASPDSRACAMVFD